MGKVSLKNMTDSPLFSGLTTDEITSLEDLFVVQHLASGKTIFIENMLGEFLYLIKKGSVAISQMLGEIDEQVLVVLGSGETFGELALIDESTRATTARVVDDAVLYMLSRDNFMQLVASHPQLGMGLALNIFRTFSQRMRQAKLDYRNMLIASLERKKG